MGGTEPMDSGEKGTFPMIKMTDGCRVRERRVYPRVVAGFGLRMIDVQLSRIESFPDNMPCYETQFDVTDAVGTNISEGGIAFETRTQPSMSSIFGLEFTIPPDQGGGVLPSSKASPQGEKGFRAVGQVVWTVQLEKTCAVGIRFIDQNPPRSAALRRLAAKQELQGASRQFARGGIQNPLDRR